MKITLVRRKYQASDCCLLVAEWDVSWVALYLYTIVNKLYFSCFLTSFFRRLEIFPQKVYSYFAYPSFLLIFKYPDNGKVPVPNTSTLLFHIIHLSSHVPASYCIWNLEIVYLKVKFLAYNFFRSYLRIS
jgi:hypothetical protein